MSWIDRPEFAGTAGLHQRVSSYNNSAIATLRLALDEVFTDHRFFVPRSMSPCQVADHILTLVRQGERDLDCLKASVFQEFLNAQRVASRSRASLPIAASGTAKRAEIMP
jgi:hypothetical protein